ncbi:MAG: LPS assembly lipoprotein LptE [Puniceicoccales bacterium]|jgi:hypothetical protein|nr:LPS assembly lipoprotein LptE [Puniceicoccales bacterium]
MRSAGLVLIIVPCLLLCGCARYQLGNGSELPFEKIYIAPVRNDSVVPQMQTVLSAQIRQKLLRHPRVKLASNSEADVILTVTIVHFDQSVAATMSNDTVRAKSFTLNVRAECSLFDSRTGEYLFRGHTVGASIDSRVEGDYLRNKSQVIPQLSLKLAERIGNAVCNPW